MSERISNRIDELNKLWEAGDSNGRPDVEQIIGILRQLRAQGYSVVKKTAWDFFRLDLKTASGKNAELHRQIEEANDMTNSSFLKQDYSGAKKWRETKLKLEHELEASILSEIKNPLHFQLSLQDKNRLEIRVSLQKTDKHIELNAV